MPRTVKFHIDEQQGRDPYAFLYSDSVVETVNELNLPRYGLANYIAVSPKQRPTPAELQQLASLQVVPAGGVWLSLVDSPTGASILQQFDQ